MKIKWFHSTLLIAVAFSMATALSSTFQSNAAGTKTSDEMPVLPYLAAKMAEKSDFALITLGLLSGEGIDRTATEGDFYLTSIEKELNAGKVTKALVTTREIHRLASK
jgi:hypothetical protein